MISRCFAAAFAALAASRDTIRGGMSAASNGRPGKILPMARRTLPLVFVFAMPALLANAAETPAPAPRNLSEAMAESALQACAEVWAAKDENELGELERKANEAFFAFAAGAGRAIGELKTEVEKQEKLVVELNSLWEQKLNNAIVEAAAAAGKSGWDYFSQAGAAGAANLKEEEAHVKLQAAQAKLAELRASIARLQMRVTARTAANHMLFNCIKDQRAYLKGAPAANESAASWKFDYCNPVGQTWPQDGTMTFAVGDPDKWGVRPVQGTMTFGDATIPLAGAISAPRTGGMTVTGENGAVFGGVEVLAYGNVEHGAGVPAITAGKFSVSQQTGGRGCDGSFSG